VPSTERDRNFSGGGESLQERRNPREKGSQNNLYQEVSLCEVRILFTLRESPNRGEEKILGEIISINEGGGERRCLFEIYI